MKYLRHQARRMLDWTQLPSSAWRESRHDSAGLPAFDPGPRRAIEQGIAWLGRAQDCSRTADGGVARHFSLIDGWSSSYPETTGYIVETLLSYGEETGERKNIERARRMLDWLVSIQFSDGSFQGGMVDQLPCLPATFDTGQILIGLAAGVRFDSAYRGPMKRAADWLVHTQDGDGCWRKHDTPFAKPGEKVYETHVSLGLLRAATVEENRGYRRSALKQVDWALTHQHPNGWLANCCLTDPERPLTHTLGYALRGIVEAYLATRQSRYLEAACRTADGLMQAFEPGGKLPGRLTNQWKRAVNWVCLTGTSQVAECLLMLSEAAKRDDYKLAARHANAFVRRTIQVEGEPEIRGGVKGSFPVNGWYGKWQYLNWACKFMIDSNRTELRLSR